MTIIVDADISINSISWSNEYGLGLNTNDISNENGEKVHVILWTDEETVKDDIGYYIDSEGALNGVLVIQNPETEVTADIINEMLSTDVDGSQQPSFSSMYITADDVRKMVETEGLILQGCGGDPVDWLNGINEMLSEEGILKNGSAFKNISVFEHNGITNILYPFDDIDSENIDIGKLAMWRLKSHAEFGGTWLSDYLPNQLSAIRYEQNIDDDIGLDSSEASVDAPIEDSQKIEKTSTVQAYISNIHDYRVGGFTISLPTTLEDLQHFWEGAEINGWYDMRIVEVTSTIRGLEDVLHDHTSRIMTPELFDELNYLAVKINKISEHEQLRETFEAVIKTNQHCGSIAELIKLTENLDKFVLVPAYDVKSYGEIRAEMDWDGQYEAIDILRNSENGTLKDLLVYIERLEKCVDYRAYGKAIAGEEEGQFTEYGYLTWQGREFVTPHNGLQDIPDEFRIFSNHDEIIQPMLRLEGSNIAEILVKLHAICCVNTQNVLDALEPLISSAQGDYLLSVGHDGIKVYEVADAYKRGSEVFNMLSNQAMNDYSADNRMFAVNTIAHFDDVSFSQQDKDRLLITGSITELNAKSLSSNIIHHAAYPDSVSVIQADGSQKSYDLFTWSQIPQHQIANTKNVSLSYKDTDVQKAIREFVSFCGDNERACKIVDEHKFIMAINAPYMAEAQDSQPDMLRISNVVAKEMLARGDADIYKLTPQGAEKLSSIEALRHMCFTNIKETAIMAKDIESLDRWAQYTVKDTVRKIEKLKRDEQKKSHEAEI